MRQICKQTWGPPIQPVVSEVQVLKLVERTKRARSNFFNGVAIENEVSQCWHSPETVFRYQRDSIVSEIQQRAARESFKSSLLYTPDVAVDNVYFLQGLNTAECASGDAVYVTWSVFRRFNNKDACLGI